MLVAFRAAPRRRQAPRESPGFLKRTDHGGGFGAGSVWNHGQNAAGQEVRPTLKPVDPRSYTLILSTSSRLTSSCRRS